MSVKNQRSNLLSAGNSPWDTHPDVTWVKTNPLKHDRKVNVKRGKPFTAAKLCPPVPPRTEARVRGNLSLEGRKLDRRKLRNAKELENCRTARSHSANSIKDAQSGKKCSPPPLRTRSMSPTPSTPPLNADLPLRKFYSYSEKIVDQFEIVKIFVNRQSDTAESLHEINRQRKRATEFAVRFSRNNLYQMKRLVNEIKQIIVPYPFDNMAKTDSELLCKKILLAYQTATQALQTYINYMKSGLSLDVPEKTRELILLIVDLYLCCEHLSLPGDQMDILPACKDLLLLLDVKIAESTDKSQIVRQTGEKARETEKEDKRFSMYKTKLTNSNWKKKTEALAKIKFGVPKLSYLKKMKKREEAMCVPRSTFEIYSQRMGPELSTGTGTAAGAATQCHKKASKMTVVDDGGAKAAKATAAMAEKTVSAATVVKKPHCTPREVTSQDDDIETVVQSIEDEDPMMHIFGDVIDTVPPGAYDDVLPPASYVNKSSVRDLVLKTIQEIQSSFDKCDVNQSLKKLLKSLDLTSVSGGGGGGVAVATEPPAPPRNVKFLHVISNEPIPEETEEEDEKEEVEDEEAEVEEDIAGEAADEEKVGRTNLMVNDGGATATVAAKEKRKCIFKAVSGGAGNGSVTSNGRTNMKVSEEMTNVVLKYRKVLSDYRRNNVMYKRGIPVRPCELVHRISDLIINDILVEISSGMEDESLLKRLYYNELLEAI